MDRISPDALADLLASRPVALLDVRTAGEYEAAHIPGSVRVSLDELRADPGTVAALLPDHAVVVCRSGNRAGQACQALAAAGREDVRILDGGLEAWARAGGEVARGRERWELERQIRLVAGTLVVAGVLGSVVWPPAVVLAGGVGAGLALAAVTGTCAMGTLLGRLPYNRGTACAAPHVADRFAHLAVEGRAAT